jgi:hypothetical protein
MTTETSNIEDFASAESSDEIEVYIRPNKDGRFVVRMGNFIVCIFGTEAEGFFLSRMELSTKFHNEPIFSLDQISKGNLQFVKNPPQGLMDAISKLIIEFPAIADELQTYNPYG